MATPPMRESVRQFNYLTHGCVSQLKQLQSPFSELSAMLGLNSGTSANTSRGLSFGVLRSQRASSKAYHLLSVLLGEMRIFFRTNLR